MSRQFAMFWRMTDIRDFPQNNLVALFMIGKISRAWSRKRECLLFQRPSQFLCKHLSFCSSAERSVNGCTKGYEDAFRTGCRLSLPFADNSWMQRMYVEPLHLVQSDTTWESSSTIIETSNLGDLYAESGQTLQGSFSAVSKPNFASTYALESSRRDLHNALLCTVLESNPQKRGKPWGELGPIPGKTGQEVL